MLFCNLLFTFPMQFSLCVSVCVFVIARTNPGLLLYNGSISTFYL